MFCSPHFATTSQWHRAEWHKNQNRDLSSNLHLIRINTIIEWENLRMRAQCKKSSRMWKNKGEVERQTDENLNWNFKGRKEHTEIWYRRWRESPCWHCLFSFFIISFPSPSWPFPPSLLNHDGNWFLLASFWPRWPLRAACVVVAASLFSAPLDMAVSHTTFMLWFRSISFSKLVCADSIALCKAELQDRVSARFILWTNSSENSVNFISNKVSISFSKYYLKVFCIRTVHEFFCK